LSTPEIVSLDGPDWTVYWLLPNEWLWRKVWEQEPPEAPSRRIPAVVPGHAQTALLRGGLLPSPYYGLDSRLWEWTSERDWVYERTFSLPTDGQQLPGQRCRLRFEGIDDAAHVFLNGRHVGDHQGQFVPAEWDVTGLLDPGEENRLLVVAERAPEVQGQIGWTSRERRWKSRFAYGWDWCTRLPPVGLWDSVSLVLTGPAWFRSVSIHPNLSIDRTEAALSIVSEFASEGDIPAVIVAEITLDGLPVADVEDPITLHPSDTVLVQSLTIPRVQLWWPNGCGRQPLYELKLSLLDRGGRLLDQRVVEFGVRDVQAVPCEGASPDSLPYGLTVNGRRVWIKGWNWVPVDQLYGQDLEERYERLLRLAKDAHVNLLRVWGGGLLEKEAFYRLCDRCGIMVWQEFPLSSSGIDNTPPSDPAYLDYIRTQAETMLPRRRNHPSLVLWCGGNELTGDDLQPLGSDHPALAELRAAVEAEDPQRLWLPTSPAGPCFAADPARKGSLHDVHGPWHWLGLRDHPAFYNGIDPLLHSEFGCEGTAGRPALEAVFEGSPPLPDTADPVWMHHGGAWWLRPEPVEAAFGTLKDVPTFVRASQLLQAMGLQYAVEANRRRKWRCAGTLPWQFNEPWPNAICTNTVDYSGRPKPAYYAVKRAYRPFHVSASFRTFSWSGEARFEADIWLHNSGAQRSLLNVVATIAGLEGRELYQENLAGEAPENSAENVGDLSWRFPPEFESPFLLLLEVVDEEGEIIARNAYLHSRAGDPAFAPLLSVPETTLRIERRDEGVLIHNAGSAVALNVAVEAGDALVEDSGFPLLPGASLELAVEAKGVAVTVQAWNAAIKELTL
jgi:beta-mannosidase